MAGLFSGVFFVYTSPQKALPFEKRAPHSRYFSDELGALFIYNNIEHMFTCLVTYGIIFIWKNIYLKDIILWTLFSGLTICMNAVAGEADEKYISKVLKDNIRFTVVTEFLLSTFTFSFWVELIIIPITTVIVLFDTVAEHKSDAIAVHKLLQDMMAFAGLCVILQTVRVGILEYRELNVINTLVSFFIPIVYLLLVTPLEYAFELYSKYEMLFIQMHFKEPRDKKVKRKRHLKVIKACGLSVRKIILFQKQCIPRMYVSMSDSEFEALISQLEEICL